MKKITPIIYNDEITRCDIVLVKENMYILKDGKKMRLNAFVLNQSRRERN